MSDALAVSLADIEAAAARIKGVAVETRKRQVHRLRQPRTRVVGPVANDLAGPQRDHQTRFEPIAEPNCSRSRA